MRPVSVRDSQAMPMHHFSGRCKLVDRAALQKSRAELIYCNVLILALWPTSRFGVLWRPEPAFTDLHPELHMVFTNRHRNNMRVLGPYMLERPDGHKALGVAKRVSDL